MLTNLKNMKPFNRRSFLKASATGAAGMALIPTVNGASSDQPIRKEKVIKRKLGNTGLDVAIVGMGCGRVDSPAVVKAALKMGINHFDTAHGYQRGNSEKTLGETLKEYPRDSFNIATKVKNPGTKEEFLEMLDLSLERLQMEYVDILYLHSVKKKEDVLDPVMIEALKEAKASGKAKHIGVSTHRNEVEVIQAAIDSEFYEVVLTTLNFKQEHAQEILDKIDEAAQKGIGIIAMKVMAGGFLDEEKQKPVNYKAALKWSLQNENVHTTIPSILNIEQLMENAEVLSDIKLSGDDMKSLELASAETGLYCNGCEECVRQCVKNLPIPDIMRSFMYAYGYNHSLKAKEVLSGLKVEENPCIDCNTCKVVCTKGFNVAQRISEVSKVVNIPDAFLA